LQFYATRDAWRAATSATLPFGEGWYASLGHTSNFGKLVFPETQAPLHEAFLAFNTCLAINPVAICVVVQDPELMPIP